VEEINRRMASPKAKTKAKQKKNKKRKRQAAQAGDAKKKQAGDAKKKQRVEGGALKREAVIDTSYELMLDEFARGISSEQKSGETS
jgi:hypothetical protein